MRGFEDLMRLFQDATRTSRRPRQRRCALGLERLEDRVALATFVVSNLNDSGAGSLRQAIAQSNATLGPNEIDFAIGSTGTITLTSGRLTIARNDLTIVGPGADQLSVSGDATSRVFEVDSVSASISGLTITGGSAPGSNGGGLYNNDGTVTIADCSISGNSAGTGGGLYNYNATMTIANSMLSDNSASYGAGLYNNCYNDNPMLTITSPVTITGSTISNNSAASSGGGLENNNGGLPTNNGGILSIADCTISGNSASLGGGLHSYGGTVTVANSTISDNSVVNGGGLYCVGKVGSTVTIAGSTISDNSAADSAGLANNGGAMTITDSTIRDNSATGNGVAGGGVDNYTGSTLTILRTTISGNSVSVYGGGIDNIEGAAATIVDSTISNNRATGDGVHAPLGGGIYSYNATLLLANSSLSDNSAAYGGGLYNNSYQHTSLATITDCTISGNTALQDGAGFANNVGAALTITGSAISGNSASGNGGGLHNFAGTVTVANSTISDDSAINGGGLSNSSGAMTITDCTISGDTARDSGGGIAAGGGLTTLDTIIAGNRAASGPDVSGNLGSQGYNLIGNPQGLSGWIDSDLLHVDPLLGPLQDNGGSTGTMALLAGSPALNAGDPNQAGIPDQRGVIRSGGVAIGAFQASAAHLVVSAAATTTAGVAFDVSVAVVDPDGQLAVGYIGTISFSSLDPHGATLPGSWTFQASDAGQATFPAGATLFTAGTWDVSVTDTANNLSGTTDVNVIAGSAVAFVVMAPATAVSGTPFDVTILAVDTYGNTDMNYTGTILFTTTDSDPGVVLPPDYTFQPGDAGQATFSAGVTLFTPGQQTLSVTDSSSGINGSTVVTL
jgi:hypothetical protein